MKARDVFLFALILISPLVAAEPKAIIKGPEQATPGSLVVMTAAESVGDGLAWMPLDTEVGFRADPDGKAAVFAAPLAQGVYRFALMAGSVSPEGKVSISKAVHTLRVVAPGPDPIPTPTPVPPVPPEPPPTPSPIPIPIPPPNPPVSEYEALGRFYGAVQVESYATTWDESAAMLAAGTATHAALMDDFQKRWGDRRTADYQTVAMAFAKIVPGRTEPTAGQKLALVQAWRDFAKGVRSSRPR